MSNKLSRRALLKLGSFAFSCDTMKLTAGLTESAALIKGEVK
jgi:hypothetical protein